MRHLAVELLTQVRDGKDIPAPAKLLASINAGAAMIHLPNRPYSIATNLAHACFWQTLWVHRLQGVRARSITEDWAKPDLEDWEALRAEFTAGLDQAIAIASSEPLTHSMKNDEIAIRTLCQIAIHDSYHLGEIQLLKRELRLHQQSS